jgi:hypothetical protein
VELEAMTPEEISEYPEDLQELVVAYSDEIGLLMLALQNGNITVEQWYISFESIMTQFMLAAAMIGVSSVILPALISANVAVHAAAQIAYLTRFRDAIILAGGVIALPFMARAQMYVNNIIQPFWAARTHTLPLPKQPTEDSECGGRCRCHWDLRWIDKENGDCDAYWLVDAHAEHCPTCKMRGRDWSPLEIRKWDLVNFHGTKELKEEIINEIKQWHAQ